MAYELVSNGSTQFAVDWSVIARLVRAYWSAKYRAEYATVKTVAQTTWNPFSWSLPEISSVEVPWDEVRGKAEVMAFLKINELRNIGDREMRYVAVRVRDQIRQTERLNASFMDLMASTQSTNMDRIEHSVASYESKKEIAKFLRDTSADALMVGATVATGGAAGAILAGGSTLKGYARYQDSDSIAAGVLTGVGNLGFGAFQIAGGSKGVLVIVQATWETGTCLVEGKTFAESVATGSLKLGGLAVDRVFKAALVKQLVGAAALPLTITYGGANVAQKALEGVAKKLLQKQGVERLGKAGIQEIKGALADDPPTARPSLTRTATLSDELLLKLAVVNMEKGIGNGW